MENAPERRHINKARQLDPLVILARDTARAPAETIPAAHAHAWSCCSFSYRFIHRRRLNPSVSTTISASRKTLYRISLTTVKSCFAMIWRQLAGCQRAFFSYNMLYLVVIAASFIPASKFVFNTPAISRFAAKIFERL
jgi:hypothetical protein